MNSKIKIGIIGTGNISNMHMKGYINQPDDVEVIACCDTNLERAKEYAEKYGIEHVFQDYNEMLKMNEIDAVSVCTWNNGHAPATIAALKAGKNVLCEKPMALNTAEALEMEKAAKESGKLLMVGFCRRFGQNMSIMNDFINNDRIGDIYYVQTKCVRRAGNPCGWFSDLKRSGGGPLIDLGVHMIDLGRLLMKKPKAISVYGVTFNKLGTRLNLKEYPRYSPVDPDPYCDVEDSCIAMIRFDNGAMMSVEATFCDHISENEKLALQIHGTKAGATLEPNIEIYGEMDNYLTTTKPSYAAESDTFLANFLKETIHFIDCIKNGTECMNPPEDGVEMMRILDAIYESARTGHEVIL